MSTLDVRLELPCTVGSTSREGRLHHVLDKTLMRRSYSRDMLPRLQRSENDLKMSRIKGVYTTVDDCEVRRRQASVVTNSLARGYNVGLTSVSCPDRLGNVDLSLQNRGQRFPSYKISNKKSTAGGRSRKSNRLPSTGTPTMQRAKEETMASRHIEKLPTMPGQLHQQERNTSHTGSRDRLPKVNPSVGKERTILPDTNNHKKRQSKAHPKRTLLRSSSITKLNSDSDEDHEAIDNDPLQRENIIPVKPLVEQETHKETRQRKISKQEQVHSGRPLPALPDESETDLPDFPPPSRQQKERKLRRISHYKSCVTPEVQGPTPAPPRKMSTTPSAASKMEWYRPRFIKPGQALGLFKRSGRKVYLILSWFKSLSKKQDTTEQTLKSFLDMAKDLEEVTTQYDIQERSGGLSFDPGLYSANKEIHLSEESRSILTTPSRGRNPDMIQKVLSVLQNLKAFAEYPLHMQQKFARVAWFQEVPPKRIILKQGHFAENFYFILSGKAIVKQITKDPATGDLAMRAVARMQNGQSFGEVALLHQTVRTATVESASNMHILVITREDFQRIFFNTQDGQDPEHINFCRNNVSFLQGFPMDICMEVPGTCLFHYFRPGAVVVPDSKKNDWIYIVRSGSCKVLKRLDAVNPTRPWCERKLDLRVKLPREGTADPGPRIDTRLRSRTTMGTYPHYEHSEDDLTSYDSEEFDEPYEKNAVNDERPMPAPLPDVFPGPEETGQPRVRMTRFALPSRPGTCESKNVLVLDIDGDERDTKKRRKAPKSAPNPVKSPRINGKTSTKPGYSESKLFFLPEIKKTYLKPVMPQSWADYSDEDDDITLADAMTIEARSTRSYRPHVPAPKQVPTCFVQLRTLRPRDAFGLEMIKFDDDKAYSHDRPNTSVTLVSNGCELIMLSRRFFERHATEESKKHIREKIRPFPTEETLQHNLQIEVNWDLFRKDTVGEFLDGLNASKNLNKII